MASYKGVVIGLNQESVDALKDLAKALPGAKDDLNEISKKLRSAFDQNSTGLGIKRKDIEEIVEGYDKIAAGIGDTLVSVSEHMKNTAKEMQTYIDTDDEGHGPIPPKVKKL